MIAIPIMLITILGYGFYQKIDVFNVFIEGVKKGFGTILNIAPILIGLITAVYMLRASGVLDIVSNIVAPFFNVIGIPPECASLMILKPISGGGGMAIGSELLKEFGADSYIGRVVAVMLASSETSFYTLTVYFGSVGINKIKYALVCALFADILAFLFSAYTVSWFF